MGTTPELVHTCPISGAETKLFKVTRDKGLTFAEAKAAYDTAKQQERERGDGEESIVGFYSWRYAGVEEVAVILPAETTDQECRKYTFRGPSYALIEASADELMGMIQYFYEGW